MQRAFFRRRGTQASSAITIALGLWAWACGGEAIIDPPLDGSGGANATSSTSGGMGSAGLGCVGAPDPSGDLNQCVTVGVTSGGATNCSASLCDELGGLYTTECSDQGCRCSYDFEVICTCFVEGTSDICGSPELSCCPEPFPGL